MLDKYTKQTSTNVDIRLHNTNRHNKKHKMLYINKNQAEFSTICAIIDLTAVK